MIYLYNKNAPRFRKTEFKNEAISVAKYEKWQAENPNFKITYREFLNIWNNIASKIRYEIVHNPQGFRLPFYGGDIFIQYLPRKFKSFNINDSVSVGDNVPNLNIVSKGKTAKIIWFRKDAARYNPYIVLYGYGEAREIGMASKEAITANPELYRNRNI